MSIDSLKNLLNCAKTRKNYVVGFVVQGWEDASSFVKHILKRHEAKLEIRSDLDSGSEFLCIFPKL